MHPQDLEDVSQISILSKKMSDRSKCVPSTQYGDSPNQKSIPSTEFRSCEMLWEREREAIKVAQLRKEIQKLQKYQSQMEKKFQKCLEMMLIEIEFNNQSNGKLSIEVSSLRNEVAQSRKDILIIDQYMKNNLKREGRGRRPLIEAKIQQRVFSRDVLGSVSSSKVNLLRRTPMKLFKSKLTLK